jgi:flagellar basal-body rod protein FlgF
MTYFACTSDPKSAFNLLKHLTFLFWHGICTESGGGRAWESPATMNPQSVQASGGPNAAGAEGESPMENAMLVALSRQVALSRELEVVANKIANLDTVGFKGDGAIFQEFIGKTARSQGITGNAQVSFVQDRATWIDLSQGPLERTGNALDVAIEGNGFLAVQTPRGERYTRNGALHINASGELVTSEGFQVLGTSGPITFQPKDHNVTISQDGTVSVQVGDTTKTEAQRGKLRMAGFENPGVLQKDGSSTFMAPQGVAPQEDTVSRFVQGTLEKSNVRGVIEMTRMIEVTRTYQQVAGILSQQSDLQQTAIDKLADVPGA